MKTHSCSLFKYLLVPLAHLLAFTLAVPSAQAQVAGALDATFAPVVGGGGLVTATAVQPNGGVIIVGSFTTVGGAAHANIARITPDNTVDASFTPGTNAGIQCVAVQPDGKILIGGSFSSVNGSAVSPTTGLNGIARLNANGTTDTTFNAGLGGTNDVVQCIALQADGFIVIGGDFTSVNQSVINATTGLNYIARLEPTGITDGKFNTISGIGLGGTNNVVQSIAIQADGKLVIGGAFTTVNGNNKDTIRISRLNANGTQDLSYTTGSGANNRVYCVAAQPDGKMVIGGTFTSVAGSLVNTTTGVNRIARINPDGTRDTTFNTVGGVGLGGANSVVYSLAVQTDGKIVMSGAFTSVNGSAISATTGVNRIARLDAEGRRDTAFNASGGVGLGGADGVTYSVGGLSTGRLVIGGAFANVNAAPRTLAARLTNDASTQMLTAPSPGEVLWTRSGAMPEVSHVTFELSDDGTTWTDLGSPTRVGSTPNWQRLGLALPLNFILRVRGRVASGTGSGSSGIIEQVVTLGFPDMLIVGNGSQILDGDATPAPEDFTDFGSTTLAGGTVKRTFTISNLGSVALNLTGAPNPVIVGGASAADFTVTALPASPVAPASPTTFEVTFDPSGAGLRTATLSIDNNDPDENPYNFTIQGTGNPAPTDITLSAGSIAENNAANATVGTLSAADNVGDINTFTLVTGTGSTDNASFTIVGTALKITPSANFEIKNSYAIRIRTTDTALQFFEKTFTVSITNVNDAPVITSNGSGAAAAINITENTTAVTTVTASDADLPAQVLTFTKTGTDAALFNLNASGVLTFIAPPDFEGTHGNTYTLTVTVTDNGSPALNDTQALTITITNVNDAPVITSNGSGAAAAIGITENTTAVTTVIATDADLPAQVLTFTKSGTDAALFNLSASGVLTFIAAPDFEGAHGNTYAVTVTVTDNGAPAQSDSQALTITVANANEGPGMVGLGPVVTNEDTPISVNFTVVDPDAGAVLTLSVTSSSNTTLLPLANVVFTTGAGNNRTVTFTPAANENGFGTVQLNVSDGSLGQGVSFSFAVNSVNDAPGFVVGANQSVLANSGAATIAGFASGISPGPANEAAQTVSFTVTNSNNALFTTQPAIASNGTLTFTPAAAPGTATVSVTAVDNGGVANGGVNTGAVQTFTISIGNPAPTDIALSANSMAENNAANATVGTLSATDNLGDVNTFTLVTGAGSTDNASFTIAGNVLRIAPVADFETKNSYAIRVRTTDTGPGFFEKAFTVSITNINESPTISDIVNQTTNEDTATGAIAFTLADPDAGTVFTVTATSSNTALLPAANIFFSGSGGTRTITLTPAAQANGTSTITVQISDGVLTATDTFLLTVNPVNDAPSFVLSGLNPTAQAGGVVIGPFTFVTSSSAGPANESTQSLTYVTSNNNNALFLFQPVINPLGELTFTPGNTVGTATITVSAVDNGGTANGGINTSASQTFTISITNPAPTDISLSASSLAENNAANATVGTLTATDNIGDTNVFTLVTGTGSTDNASFTLAGNILRLTPSANFEVKNSYAVRIRTTDGGALFFEKAFTIAITNVNEPPTITDITNQTAAPNQSIGTNFSVADPDAGTVFAISFTSSNPSLLPVANINFIHSGGGNYLLTLIPASNQSGSSTVTAQVSDGTLSASDTFIYTVNAVNQAPSFTLATDPLGTAWTARELVHDHWTTIACSADGTKLAAGQNPGKIHTSNNGGVTWTEQSQSPAGSCRTLVSSADGTRLVAAVAPIASTSTQLHISTDSGVSWTPRGPAGNWSALTSSADGSKLAGAMQNGSIHTSSDFGLTWTARGPNGPAWTSLTSSSDGVKLAAASFGGDIYLSIDSGTTWALQPDASLPHPYWASIASSADGTRLAAAAYNGNLWTSANSGQNWTVRQSIRQWTSIASSADGTKLAAVDFGGQIHTSPDAGANWTARESARGWRSITSSADGSKLAAADFYTNLYTSLSTGLTPTAAACSGPASYAAFLGAISPGPAPEAAQTVTFTVSNNNNALFLAQPAIASNGTLTFTPASAPGTAIVTVTAIDNGGTANGGINTSAPQLFNIIITPTTPTVASILPASGSTAGGNGVTITGTCFTGATSVSIGGIAATGLNVINATTLTCIVPAHAAGSASVNVTTPGGTNGTNYIYIYIAPNSPPKFDLPIDADVGNAWTAHGPAGNWKAVATSYDNTIIAAAATNGPIHVSNDSGLTWTPTGPVGDWVSLTASVDGTKLAAVAFNGKIHTSLDSGRHWTAREYTRRWCALAASANGLKLAAVVRGGYIYTSNNAGITWTERASSRNWIAIDSSLNGERLAAVDYLGKIYTSEDSGSNWTARTGDGKWNSIVITADGLGVGATDEDGRFFTTFNGGVNWQEQPPLARGTVARGCHYVVDRKHCVRVVFIDPEGPIEISEDFGLTKRVVDTHRTWSSLAIGEKLIAAENGGRIYISNPDIANPTIHAASGQQTIPYFVRNISPGTASEAEQAVNFTVSNSNNALFITQPTISPDGTLTFTPGNTAGTAVVTVRAQDNGGTAFGGQDTSAPQVFSIVITPALSPLAAWRQLHFGNATTGAGNLDDPDGDGIANLTEYAFGLIPTSNASNQIPEIVPVTGRLQAAFTQPAGVSGIIYGAQWSPDLLNWTPVPEAGTGHEHHFSIPITGQRKYMRLTVTPSP
jgi:uncharacterized delta-60 repeat protein